MFNILGSIGDIIKKGASTVVDAFDGKPSPTPQQAVQNITKNITPQVTPVVKQTPKQIVQTTTRGITPQVTKVPTSTVQSYGLNDILKGQLAPQSPAPISQPQNQTVVPQSEINRSRIESSKVTDTLATPNHYINTYLPEFAVSPTSDREFKVDKNAPMIDLSKTKSRVNELLNFIDVGAVTAKDTVDDFSRRFVDMLDNFDANNPQPISKKAGSVLNVATGAAGLIPSWLVFNMVLTGIRKDSPSGEIIAKAIDYPITKVSELGSKGAGKFVDALPISQEAKDNIKGPLEELSGLMAIIIAGHATPAVLKRTNELRKTIQEQAIKTYKSTNPQGGYISFGKIIEKNIDKLPPELRDRIEANAYQEAAFKDNPLNKLTKYESKSKPGELPEVVGKGEGKYKKIGDQLIAEIVPESFSGKNLPDTKDIGEMYSTFISSKRAFEKEQIALKKEALDYLKSNKGGVPETFSITDAIKDPNRVTIKEPTYVEPKVNLKKTREFVEGKPKEKIVAKEETLLKNRIRAEADTAKKVVKNMKEEYKPKLEAEYGKGEVTGYFQGEKEGRTFGKKIGEFKTKVEYKAKIADIKKQFTDKANTKDMIKQSISQFVTKNLPVSERGRFVNAVATAETMGKLNETFQRATRTIDELKKLEAQSKTLGSLRSKQAFLTKIGEFANVTIRDIKKQLGLEGVPIRKMTESELNAMIAESKVRLDFAKKEGLLENAPLPRENGKISTPEDYRKAGEIYAQSSKFSEQIKTAAKNTGQGIKDIVRKSAKPLSSVMRDINIDMKVALRNFEQNSLKKVADRTHEISEFSKAFSNKIDKISKQDAGEFALALANRDKGVIDSFVTKYGLEKEYKKVNDTLKEIREEGQQYGFDIGNLDNYFPRAVKDSKGLAKYIYEKDGFSMFEMAFEKEKAKLKRELTLDEKTKIVSNIVRGFGMDNIISLSAAKNFKTRGIDLLDPEMLKFYHDPVTALSTYIRGSTDAIEARKFFGKGIEGVKNPDVSVIDLIESSIPAMVAEGKLKLSDEAKFMDAIKARFGDNGVVNPAIRMYKDVSYMSTIGNFISTITQLGDVANALYKAPKQTVPAFIKSVFGKSEFDLKKMGIEKLEPDVTGGSTFTGRATEKTFKASLFSFADRVMKQTPMEAIVSKYKSDVKKIPNTREYVESFDLNNFKRTANNNFMYRMREVFGTDKEKIIKAIDELKTGKNGPMTETIAFNELSDIQPVSMSEMPEYYNKLPNGRIFWMLKSFTLKQFDNINREALQLMKHPIKDPKTALLGVRNLAMLTTLLATANASTDVIKNTILGRKTNISDLLFDNILRLVPGLSKYSIYQAKKEGVGSVFTSLITPPMKMVNDISKDLTKVYNGTSEGFLKSDTLGDIPFVGKPLYWWMGAGADSNNKDQKTQNEKILKDLGIEIPSSKPKKQSNEQILKDLGIGI